MRAVVSTAPGATAVLEVPDPQPGPGEVLLRVTSCGLCGTDLHILDGELPSAGYPLVPGHELTGEVTALGAGVTGPAVGSRVAVDPNMPCGSCPYCRVGRGNLCDHYSAVGVTRDGGFAEQAAVPASCCYLLPDSLSEAAASLVEPLSCAVHGLNRLPRRPAEHHLIYGAGTMGLMMAAVVGNAGAASVSMVDLNEERLAFAKTFAADETATDAEAFDRPQGFDVVIDATGAIPAIEDGLGRVRKGGTFLQFGVTDPQQTAKFSPFRIYNSEIDILGSMAVHHSFQPAIDLLSSGLELDALVSDTFALDEFDEAATAFRVGTGRKIQIASARHSAPARS